MPQGNDQTAAVLEEYADLMVMTGGDPDFLAGFDICVARLCERVSTYNQWTRAGRHWRWAKRGGLWTPREVA